MVGANDNVCEVVSDVVSRCDSFEYSSDVVRPVLLLEDAALSVDGFEPIRTLGSGGEVDREAVELGCECSECASVSSSLSSGRTGRG